MAGVIAAVFMTVMTGVGNVTSSNSYMIPPPTVTKETVIVSSMAVCRKLEAAFHNGYSTSSGETKTSTVTYSTDRSGLSSSVIRESSCTEGQRMSRTKEDMRKAHEREIDIRTMAAVLEELFQDQQEYDECLKNIRVHCPYLSVGNSTYVIFQTLSGWQIEAEGKSTVKEIMLPLVYCKRALIVESLRELVLHIVTTYHPNGVPLFID
ncbi:hypothetical protein L0F63_007365 [Massospora cicadina]|nr:hypothetical protein L0F63_007365 [Massospora cicadina]